MEKVRDVIDLGRTERAPARLDAAAATPPSGANGLATGALTSPALDDAAAPVSHAAQEAADGGADASAKTDEGAIPQAELDRITADVVKGLKSVYDPEIPVDIYELGLIYKVDLSDDRLLTVDMTLTAPGCPVAGEMPGWVEGAVRGVDGVDDVKVNMVFEPPWTPDRMSDEAKLELGWM